MLIPSIDLMGGKIVQLEQGEKKKLEFSDFEYWIEKFSKYPIVQLIDLDAARGTGNNRALMRTILERLKCQVGGGIRDARTAREILEAGARKIIVGSSLLKQGEMKRSELKQGEMKQNEIDTQFARELAEALGKERLVFAIDSRGGRVAVEGWRKQTNIGPLGMVRALEAFCDTFLYTNIETEGMMGGLPLEPVQALRKATTRHLIVAGGITTAAEIEALDAMGIDAVVGMAVYTGKIPT